jgi:hypothetical protein
MSNLLNTLYVKMLTAREMDLQRKREDMQNEDVKSQKAAQFALDVSRHIEDSKQKEFWRKSQLAGKEGEATGQLGLEKPMGYEDPAVQEYADVGHLGGQAAFQKLQEQAKQREMLEKLRIGGRVEVEGTKHGYRTQEIDQRGGIKLGLQNDQQEFTTGRDQVLEGGRNYRAGVMAGAANNRATLNRDQQAKESAVKFYTEMAKQQGPMGRLLNPTQVAEIDAFAESLLPLAQDPSVSPQQFNQYLRKMIEQKVQSLGKGSETPGDAPEGAPGDFTKYE